MTGHTAAVPWQETAWNGISLQLPANWQPSVIYPDYLFFEQEGFPVFELKWQLLRGKFSVEKTFRQLRRSFPQTSRLSAWKIPPDIQSLLTDFTAAGFRVQEDNSRSYGLILFCPECRKVTLLQWRFDPLRQKNFFTTTLASFRDHSSDPDELWTIFDVRMLLPSDAQLRSHEFLPGRYILGFALNGTLTTLYRFKPAAALLDDTTLGGFGHSLTGRMPVAEEQNQAFWLYRARRLDLLLAKARRSPSWQWMRLRHDPGHNVILGVKAEGKPAADTDWLEKIYAHFTAIAVP